MLQSILTFWLNLHIFSVQQPCVSVVVCSWQLYSSVRIHESPVLIFGMLHSVFSIAFPVQCNFIFFFVSDIKLCNFNWEIWLQMVRQLELSIPQLKRGKGKYICPSSFQFRCPLMKQLTLLVSQLMTSPIGRVFPISKVVPGGHLETHVALFHRVSMLR